MRNILLLQGSRWFLLSIENDGNRGDGGDGSVFVRSETEAVFDTDEHTNNNNNNDNDISNINPTTNNKRRKSNMNKT